MCKRTILTSIIVLLIINASFSQCDFGTINQSIWGSPSTTDFGFTIDSDITDEDTAQVIQGSDTTIYIQYLLPEEQDITTPIVGTATVTSVEILGVTGLPIGMDWILDSVPSTINNNTYYPQTYRYGVVTLCGTTFSSPGLKTVTVSTIGCGTLSGISQCEPVSFNLYIEVLAGQGGNSAFTMSSPVGCNSVDIDFEAIFTSPDSVIYPLDFSWDLGDGTTTTGTNISAHNYSSPGVYPVKLEVTINEFYISSASVVCTGGWYPDVEEISSFFDPEPYIDLNGTQTSSGSGTSVSWSGLDITLNSTTINGQTYDEDDGGLFGSADDDLGSGSTIITPVDGGSYNIATANSNITFNINKRVSDVLTFWDTVFVYSNSVATITSSNGTSFCSTDSTFLDVGLGYDAIQWYEDTTLLIGETNQTLNVNTSGSYYAVVVETGNICEGTTNTINISVENVDIPIITNSINGIEINNPNGYSVQWYSNGVPILGETSDELTNLSSGNPFSVVVTSASGCNATSADFEVCSGGYAYAPNGTAVIGNTVTSFEAIGFSYNSQTEIAWSVTPVADGMITTVSDVASISTDQIYLGNATDLDLFLNCNSLLGDGSYYLTPFLIEAVSLSSLPFPYSDTSCIPSMGLDIVFDCVNQDWEIGNASVVDPSGTPIDLLSLSPIPISYPIGPSLICSALGGAITGVDLFSIAPSSNPNGTWSIEVMNSGIGVMNVTIPAFQVVLYAADCSDITTDIIYDYGPYNIAIPAGGTEAITIQVPPLPISFPSIASNCSAFGTPVVIDISNIASTGTITSSNGTSFCGTDSTILDVDTGYSAIQWYNNSTLLTGETNQTLTVNTSGSYYAVVLGSGNVCEATTNTITISVDPITTPIITVSANGLEIDNPNGYSVQWYSNGVPISGATSDELTDLSGGNPFSVVVTNANGCTATSADYDGCFGGYADAPNGTDVVGGTATTFEALGFTYNSQTEIAWSVSPIADGMITTEAQVDALNPLQVYLGDGNEIDLLLNCGSLAGPGTYYLTPFLIEAVDLPEFPFPYSDTPSCIPTMGLDIMFDCVNQDWEIGNASVVDPSGTPIDLLSLSPIPLTYPLNPTLICGGLGGVIADVNLFAIAPNSNPNGTWSIEVENSGTGDMDISIPAFEVALLASVCSDISQDMVYTYGPYDLSIAPGETEVITIQVPPLPDDFPSIASSCSAFGTPVEIEVTDCESGIDDVLNTDNISLYPNPNSGEFILSLDLYETNDMEISIIDVTGRVISNRNYNNVSGHFTETFDLKNKLNSGFYFMNIKLGNYTTQKKFIVR